MDIEAIRNRIYSLRKSKGSRREMVDATGIGEQTITALEKGSTHIIYENLPKIASYLGVSLEYLLLGYEPASPLQVDELRESALPAENVRKVLTEEYEDKLQAKQDEINRLKEKIADLEYALTLARKAREESQKG